MGLLDGKVAFITGAARGQGRSHAVRLAQEGADIIAVDLAAQPETVKIPGATAEDLAETARQVESLDRRIVTRVADVRDVDVLAKTVADGVAELGRLDIVLGNAAIWALNPDEPADRASRQKIWRETIDINLTGQFNVIEATAPTLIEQGTGGAIVLTSSTAGLKSMSINSLAQTAYGAAKHGVVA
jgi:NAD(P)-dependent dehydrogenase (short-subunit alcohol dehydrogenase family)